MICNKCKRDKFFLRSDDSLFYSSKPFFEVNNKKICIDCFINLAEGDNQTKIKIKRKMRKIISPRSIKDFKVFSHFESLGKIEFKKRIVSNGFNRVFEVYQIKQKLGLFILQSLGVDRKPKKNQNIVREIIYKKQND